MLIPLSAGPLSLLFDRENAFLRYVCWGDQEIVRGIFAAVRDRNWNTIPFEIADFDIQQTSDSFQIRFVANSLDRNVDFRWNGIIDGTAQGTVGYRFHGLANAPFERNRIGLCVLHPSDHCAGEPCRIEHVNGSITDGVFPDWISPHQPFREIRAISHALRAGGPVVRVSLTGEVFEMEDQRNWTDASYKTYGTPLSLPFPVQVEAGTVIQQSVTIELLGAADVMTPVVSSKEDRCELEIDWRHPMTRPALGFQIGEVCVDKLKELCPDHLRVDVRITEVGWQQILTGQIELAQSLNTKLEIAIFADSIQDSSWSEAMQFLQQPLPLARLLLFHTRHKTTPPELATYAYTRLAKSLPELPIVVGTDAYFAELNRGRPAPINGGQVCYSINPQVHAFDNLSLSETLQAQRDTVDSAVHYFGTNVVISPVTLRPRFNPNATASLDRSAELAAAVDPRQKTGYGAAWTVGVFASLLTHPRVSSITLYEMCGPRGIMDCDGSRYPLCEPIETVLRSRWVYPCRSNNPLELVALATQQTDGYRGVLIGNLTDREQLVEFSEPNGETKQIRVAAESVELVQIGEASHA